MDHHKLAFPTAFLLLVLATGCNTPNNKQSTPLTERISSAERMSKTALQRYPKCINEEAAKKALFKATPTEISGAVVAECEFILSFFRGYQLDYAKARFQNSESVITYMNHIEKVISDTREEGRGSALNEVITIRSKSINN